MLLRRFEEGRGMVFLWIGEKDDNRAGRVDMAENDNSPAFGGGVVISGIFYLLN